MPALVALPDIAIALAGILLLVLAYAIWTLRDFLVAGFSHVPVVGGWIAGRLGSVLDSAATAVTHASAAAFGGAEHFLRACLTWCQSVTGWATHIFLDIVNTVIHIAEVQVPRIYALSLRDTVSALATARHDIAAAFDTVRGDIAAAASHAAAYTDARVNAAVSLLYRRIQVTEATVSAVPGLVITDVDAIAGGAVSRAWQGVDGDVEALRRLIGRDYQSWQHLLPLLEGAGAAGLTGALIRALAGSALAVKAVDQCVLPNCDNLGKFGKDLAELGSAGSAAAMLAFLAFAVADPVAAADDTITVAGPFADAVFWPLAELLGYAGSRL